MEQVVSMLAAGAAVGLAAIAGSSAALAAGHSTLKPGDTIVLMPASGHLSPDGREWVVPVHAWVYVPQTSRIRRGAIEKVLELGYGLKVTRANERYFAPRINLLLADNKRGREVVVDVGGRQVSLPPTGPNGHAELTVRVPVSASAREGEKLAIRAILPPADPRRIETVVHLIGATGVSVISDIDDTVKITHVTDKKAMWSATFFKAFEPVEGMPAAYRRVAGGGDGKGVGFHYVSSSPWHLATPLIDFLRDSGLPMSSIELKHVRLKDRSALDIVRPGRETKPPQIAAILARYPQRRFILIGDSGEDDPEIYAALLREHPTQIERIYIRNVTGAKAADARFTAAFKGIDASRWVLFEDPQRIGAK